MRVAGIQFAPEFEQVEANVSTVVDMLATLAARGVRLAVFPEAFLTGYCFGSAEQAAKVAISSSGEEIKSIASAAQLNDIYVIVGYAEKEGDELFNSAIVVGPQGVIGNYRKTHLPFLGLDRFVTPGTDLPLFEIDEAKVGVAICYDVRVPEVSRCYALAGADIICIPTNWPESAEASSDIVCPTRAMENHVFVIAVDRVGTENGFEFIGRSKIIDPKGKVIASADHRDEAVIVADIDYKSARQKTIVKRPGEYELPLFDSRQPGLYGMITKK